MKIMLLVSSMHGGGAERVAATLVNAWAARGDDVTLVPTYSGGGESFYTVSDDVNMIRLADVVRGKALGRLGAAGRLIALRRMIRDHAPDVVVSFLTNVNVAALLATWGMQVPVIVCERTNPVATTTLGATWQWARRWLYPRADMVTVQADSTVGPFARTVPNIKRLAVVPNPLPAPLAQRAPLSAEWLAQGDGGPRLRVMAMGRMVPAKQFDVLIDVFGDLAARHPRWDLWIWGDGPDRDVLNAQIAARGLQDRIQLPGQTDQPWSELARAQAFVLSSSVEGFPNVLLEAMALGLPCITFDCPSGPREMTCEGTDAVLVPDGDADALHDALDAMLSDPARRVSMGARASDSVRGRYALPAVLMQWDELFAQVGVGPRRPVHAASHAASQRQGNT